MGNPAAGAMLLASVQELGRRAEDRPLQWFRWLPSQDAFLQAEDRRLLLRCGNQWGGKTTVGLANVIFYATGAHPYLSTPKPPLECWVICASWSQSVHIQQKFWELCPKSEIHPDTVYDAVRGFRGVNPVVRFRNGSLVRFKTSNQGMALAGATIDLALFDEPPASARIYSEVQKRVLKRNGRVLLTLTPVNAPVDWLRELVAEGQVRDLHYKLAPENLIPIGCHRPLTLTDGTPMDADWIAQVELETPPWEVPVVVHGEWEMRILGRAFPQFQEGIHVSANPPDTAGFGGQVKLALGLDHGEGTFRECATLIAVNDEGEYPRIWVLDEYVSDGDTTTDMDASRILSMLKRNGVEWRNLDWAYGDRSYGGKRASLAAKSNRDVMKEIAKVLRLRTWEHLKPRLQTAKTGKGRAQGSVYEGCRFIHECQVRAGHFYVHPRCVRLIESLNKWQLGSEEYKDSVDSLRYSLIPLTFRQREIHVPKVRFH